MRFLKESLRTETDQNRTSGNDGHRSRNDACRRVNITELLLRHALRDRLRTWTAFNTRTNTSASRKRTKAFTYNANKTFRSTRGQHSPLPGTTARPTRRGRASLPPHSVSSPSITLSFLLRGSPMKKRTKKEANAEGLPRRAATAGAAPPR